MRKSHKYQIYNKVRILSRFPLRVLRFKRPKWASIQNNFISKKKLGKVLTDITQIKGNICSWKKVKNAYRERLKNYSFLAAIFRHSISLKNLKKTKNITNRKDGYLTYIFNFYYKPCNLIFISNMLTTSFEAKQKIHSKELLVNNKIASSNSRLKKGDVLSLLDKKVNISNVSNKFNFTFAILTNIEVDYYSQNIILIKDLSELSKEDFFLLSLDYINIQKLR